MPITSVDDLLALYDRPFLAAAYTTLLGREVDDAGERFYLARLRSGVSRQQVLWEMLQSSEAQAFDARLRGLDALLAEVEPTLSPSLLRRVLPDRGLMRQAVRTENLVGSVSHQLDQLKLMVNHCVMRADQAHGQLHDLRRGRAMQGGGHDVGEGSMPLQAATLAPPTPLAEAGNALFRRMRATPLGKGQHLP